MARLSLVVFLVFLVSLICVGDGAKILGIFPMPAPSHFILGQRLFKELAKRGHEVHVISAFPQKTKVKNYVDISLESFRDFKEEKKVNLFELEKMTTVQQVMFTHFFGAHIANMTMTHPNVQKLLKSNEKFDLVISELFMNEMHIGFADHFKCPFILVSTMGSNSWNNGFVSNPAPYAYIPDLFLKYSSRMNFFERLHNTYFGLFVEFFRNYIFLPQQDKIMHEYFKDAPPLKDMLFNNISMILLNSHPITADPVPHVPKMVEIGGFHVEDTKPLPKDLQEYMDSAENGVILFSMGSNLKSAALPAEKRDAILKTFAKLKQKVLWKWEDDVLPGQPKNVKLSKWLPQNDIMAHPNLRMFLTHGGLLSTTEALHHGVPVVGIPIFGDQKMNIAHAVDKGFGLAVPYDELTEEKLTNALNEVLNNPFYRENVRKNSAAFRDQPLRPIDSAMFWIEHVLRHKGADHFKSVAQNMCWTQLYLLDVIGFSIGVILVVSFILYKLLEKCCGKKKCEGKKSEKKKKTQ